MKRLAWMTDIHLNFLKEREWEAFAARIAALMPDAILIGGDIAEAPSVEQHLERLHGRLDLPIYFVLGNHDCYRGSIAGVRATMREMTSRDQGLVWLPAAGVVRLTEKTALVGHDGWADGRYGDYARSEVMLNDYILIEELAGLGSAQRLDRLLALGDEAGAFARRIADEALKQFPNVLFLTHVPPFRDACWYNGKISDDDWLPHFTCKAVGDALVESMRERPDQRLTVLCGHTHSRGAATILPNLHVRTGGATYGAPEIQEIISVP